MMNSQLPMKRVILKYALLLFFLFTFPVVCISQAATDNRLQACSSGIVHYQDRNRARDRNYILDLSAPPRGRLLYIGVIHTFDPGHSQFSDLEKAWDRFQPTIAFFEGADTSVGTSRDHSIKSGGEPGLVRYLAARDNIPALSLEPSRQAEVYYVLRKFSAEQVKLFYVLRQTAQLRTRTRISIPELKARLPGMLRQWSGVTGLHNVITTVEEFDAACKRYWRNIDWWDASIDWFNPLKSSSQTGGVFLNEINQESSHYRNLHMYTLLAKATLEGKTVFVAVGREHIPMQEEALRCALK